MVWLEFDEIFHLNDKLVNELSSDDNVEDNDDSVPQVDPPRIVAVGLTSSGKNSADLGWRPAQNFGTLG